MDGKLLTGALLLIATSALAAEPEPWELTTAMRTRVEF